MTKLMSKSELIQKVADQHSLAKKDVKNVVESLASVGYKELKKTGAFLLPGFAKFVVIKKSATKERAGINPFTKEPTVFKAKPARKIAQGSSGESSKRRGVSKLLASRSSFSGGSTAPRGVSGTREYGGPPIGPKGSSGVGPGKLP